MDRRDFLTATAPALAGGYFVSAAEAKKPRVGLIGCGWYGKNDLFRLIQVADVEVVALCDVDSRQAEKAAGVVATRQGLKKGPKLYGDYRKMLGDDKYDIILVGTPDHWHALPMIAAVEAGADVYVQKPISVDVAEGRAMLAAARKHKRVVQVGTQRRSTPHLIDAKKRVIDAGLLGTVGHAEVCCYYHMRNGDRPRPAVKVPDHLDWEMWQGPAPERPYVGLPHKRYWRAYTEYGNGIVGDMCIHMLDMVRWLLGLGRPRTVSSVGGILVQKEAAANVSDTQSATFDFGGMQVVWQHRTWGTAPDPEYPWAGFLYGDRGTLKADVHKWEFFPNGSKKASLSGKAVFDPADKYPEDKTEEDFEAHAATANRGHQRSFLEAIRTRGKPSADIEQGYVSTTACLLANLSAKLGGRALTWDEAKGEVVGDAEANGLLKRPYRGPWKHPGA
ncbi:MAG: Gfo/Idh/MocA family protein [Gemmataceae bacterium]